MDWKKTGSKLLFPPIWLLALLTAASAFLLTMVFVRGWEESAAAYAIYVLSFYTLCIVTIFCARVLPSKYREIRARVYANPLGKRYLTDRAFRTQISLYRSLGINLLYALMNLLSWHWSRSWWFVVLAVYYVILAVMRFLLLHYVHRNKIGTSTMREWIWARICAHILLLVNLSLSGAVLMILYTGRGYDYPGVTIYAAALYTFYSTIHAVVDIIKYRSLGSPVLSTAKIVSLSAALVSMLNLETAMFAQFGADMSPENQHLMIILTGAGISAVIVAFSVVLIIKATKEIRRKKNGT